MALLRLDTLGCGDNFVDVLRGDIALEARGCYPTAVDGFVGLNAALVVPLLAGTTSGVNPCASACIRGSQAKQPVRVVVGAVMAVTYVDLDGVIGIE